jgi:phage shock protein A
MNLLERVLTLLRANLNSVVEKAEDPEKALRQLRLDMHNQLVQVKTQVATAIAESRKLQKRSQERTVEADTWLRKAEQAVQQGNDDTARAALARYNDLNRQAQRYKQHQKEQEQIIATLRSALRQLEVKLAEVETTIDLLITRKRNALIQQRVFDALNKTGTQKESAQTSKAQDAVLEAEARARALAELHQRDLELQLEQLSEEQVIEQKLRELKTRKRSSPQTPLLHEGTPQPSPLVPPQPDLKEPMKQAVTEEPGQPGPVTEISALKEADIEHLKKLLETPQNTSSQE